MQQYSWLISSFGTLFCFGCWGFFGKLTTDYLSARHAFVYQGLGVVFCIAVFQLFLGQGLATSSLKGNLLALLTGIAYAVGTGLFFVAARSGKISIVVMLTALYPIITIALSYCFLNEQISLKQMAGILLASVAILLMAT